MIGYARVSTTEQDTASQLAALRGVPCERIYEEKRSGVDKKRSALEACLKDLRAGDTLVVWKVDRLGRSMLEAAMIVDQLATRSINFVALTQSFDTRNPMGKLCLQMLMAFAEFERNMIIERTRAGMDAARAKGHFGGRRRVLTGAALERAREAYVNRPINPKTGKRMTNQELADMFGIAKPTLQRWVLHDGVPTYEPQRSEFYARHADPDLWRELSSDPTWGNNPNKQRSA